jgi:hypothetical protein
MGPRHVLVGFVFVSALMDDLLGGKPPHPATVNTTCTHAGCCCKTERCQMLRCDHYELVVCATMGKTPPGNGGSDGTVVISSLTSSSTHAVKTRLVINRHVDKDDSFRAFM